MADLLNEKVKALLRDPASYKALATVSKIGEVHVVYKGSLTVDEDGNIVVYELLDSSQTSKNLTYSLWFEKKVAVNVVGQDGTSYLIKGIPERDIVTGPEFEEKYKEFLAKNPENDLAGIWIIPPIEVKENTYAIRRQEERERYPVIGHMDRDLA